MNKGITVRPFGAAADGKPVSEIVLTNASGESVSLLDYGATIHAVHVRDKNGELRDVCLGYRSVGEYETNEGYIGATVGRYANRIAGGRFTLGGKEYTLFCNDGENSLHGGRRGFDKYIWDYQIKGERVCFSRVSEDGEEGYPGRLEMTVAFSFGDDGALAIDYTAKTDRDTPVNLTNHIYINLEGDASGDVLSHILQIRADGYTPVDSTLIPTGEIASVAGTPLDFRTPKPIGQDIEAAGGYDHNFVLTDGEGPIAVLEGPDSGIVCEVFCDLPGVQLYTGGGMTSDMVSKTGKSYAACSGLCLETQFFPDSVNHENFPSAVLAAGETYHHVTTYRFGTRK